MQGRQLNAKDPITKLVHQQGIQTWAQLLTHVRSLPYARNKNRTDLSLVLTEHRGTCSSKHALLKQLADLNNIPKVKLILGIYKMTETNTPGIGQHLSANNIEYLPEAHCYLKIEDSRYDLTSLSSDIKRIEKDILEEQEIDPIQVSQYKVNYHRSFMFTWQKQFQTDKQFDELWTTRERCITELAKTKS